MTKARLPIHPGMGSSPITSRQFITGGQTSTLTVKGRHLQVCVEDKAA